MIKVLIVDDFLVDRENMKELILSYNRVENNEMQFLQIIGLCENGSEALDVITLTKPDIVITDIEMPVMDGFELSKAIRREFPDIKLIYCSLYNDFKYAQKALYFDSYGYILKPVDSIELRNVLLKATQTLPARIEHTQEYLKLQDRLYEYRPFLAENILRNLIHSRYQPYDNVWEKIDFLNIHLTEGYYYLSLIELDDYYRMTAGLTIEQKQILQLKISSQFQNMSKNYVHGLAVQLDDSHFVILHHFDDSIHADEAQSLVFAFSNAISNGFVRTDVSLSIAVSSYVKDIYQLQYLYEQCLYILRYKFSVGKGRVLSYKDIPYITTHLDVDFNSIQKEMRFLLNSGTEREIIDYINQLFEKLPQETMVLDLKSLCMYIVICLQNFIGEMALDQKIAWEQLFQFETITDSKEWVIMTLISTYEQFQNKELDKNLTIIKNVKKYIEINFCAKITLELLSDHLYFSPNYLNYVFKKTTGQTIFDYLTDRRIEKAKELLGDNKMKLYHISEAVGYSHTAYFSAIFKKHTGFSPKDYRSQFV